VKTMPPAVASVPPTSGSGVFTCHSTRPPFAKSSAVSVPQVSLAGTGLLTILNSAGPPGTFGTFTRVWIDGACLLAT
jgi:hypothetical protein